MNIIIDQILLIIYSVASLLFLGGGVGMVLAPLLGVIGACVSYLAERPSAGWAVGLTTAVIAGAYSPIILFFPLIAYGMFYCKSEKVLILWLLPVMIHFKDYEFMLWLMIMIGIVLAWWLFWQSRRYELLLAESRRLQDDSTERALLLAEKNRSLIEKQDAETYSAILKERNRIAREIHDNVGHVLSRSLIMVGALKALNTEEKLERPMSQLEDSLSTAMTSIRESVHDLHDESMDLREVLQSLIQEYEYCPVHLVYDMGVRTPQNVKYCFIAIVKEALVNVRKHSNATEMTIIARSHPAMYQLVIEDNGTIKKADADSGIGLKNMEERVKILNGNFRIIQERGFRIFITIPREEH